MQRISFSKPHQPASYILAKNRNKRLRQPKRKRKLRPRHKQLRRQPLEETAETFRARHSRHDAHTALLDLEITVLNACFDDVEGCGDDDGGAGADDGGDEVLRPGCGVVVGEGEEVLFRCCGAAEELGRSC